MATDSNPQRTYRSIAHQTGVRFLIVAVVGCAMLIPLAMLTELAVERESYFETARRAVQTGWGDAQLVAGPMLRVAPLAQTLVWQPGGADRHTIFAATATTQAVQLEHQIRHKGIFEVPVYIATVTIEARFDIDASDTGRDWHNAQLYVALGSPYGLRDAALSVNGASHTLQPAADLDGFPSGLYAYVDASQPFTMTLTLTLRGSDELRLLPTAAAAGTRVTGSWPHPSFQGRALPDTADVTWDGFAAQWRRGQTLSNLPESWSAGAMPQAYKEQGAHIGLHEPVSVYRTVQRSAKYGVLFVAVTFLTLLCFELSGGWRFHLAQYATTGLAMLMFFLTLLALAEHVPFLAAYLLATAIICALTTWYVWRITTLRRLAATFACVLASGYGALYTLLQMEAYALLAGSLLLLLGVAALMWNTERLAERPAAEAVQGQAAGLNPP